MVTQTSRNDRYHLPFPSWPVFLLVLLLCCTGEVFLELEGSSDNMGSAGYIPELGQGQAVLVPMALDYCPKATYWVTNGGSSLAVRYQPDHDQSYK